MSDKKGRGRGGDPYVYPGTNVLRNKLDIRDYDQLCQAEYRLTRQQSNKPIPNPEISAEGFKATHRHLFGRLYDWAGEIRTVHLAKGESDFGPPHFIGGELERRFRKINAENNLQGLDARRFAERAAEHLGEINALHPFREGNGRTMKLFLENLAEQAGHKIDRRTIEPDPWIKASIATMQMDYRPMAQVIGSAVVGPTQDRERSREASSTPPRSPSSSPAPDKAAQYQQLEKQVRARDQQRRTLAARDRGREGPDR